MRRVRYSRRAWLQSGAVLAATLALAACGGAVSATAGASSASDTAAAPTTSSASAAPSVATSSAAPTGSTATSAGSVTTAVGTSATTAAAASSSAAPAVSAITSGAASSAAGTGVKLTLDSTGTQASYQVQEQLAGKSFPTPAIGRTSAVTGAIVLDAGGKIVPSQSKFTIDMRTLKSDQGMRDNYIQHDPLQTAQYPTATFVPQQVTGMPWPLPASGTAKFNLVGDMTVHGTTASTTWAVDAAFAADKVTGTATTPFTFTEFGMTAPHTMIALSVQNNGTLTLEFSATKATT